MASGHHYAPARRNLARRTKPCSVKESKERAMGYLLNGTWTEGDPAKQTGKAGTFDRIESVFRDRITADGSSGFKAEAGRYHLYVAHSCPWAHRTMIYRAIKKL